MNPRLWSLAKQSSFKVENSGPKVPKQDEVKRDGVNVDLVGLSVQIHM